MPTESTDLALPSPVLSPAQFAALADVPPEREWLANLTNDKTRRAYQQDVKEFCAFAGIKDLSALRSVARSHIIAWRVSLESRQLAKASIRRKLSALSSLFEYLCERNAILGNPVDGVKRPMVNGNEGSTPALGDEQARRLLNASPPDTLKGLRDRAILATLLYHGIRREELCKLKLRDLQSRLGVMHFRVEGKREKIRFIPAHPTALRLIAEYRKALQEHGGAAEIDLDDPLFRPVKNNRTGTLQKHLDPGSIYRNIVMKYARATGLKAEVIGVCVHSMRATAATNALSHEADIAKVQECWGMRIFQQRGFMTGAIRSRRTARHFM